jgi:hypothetical protein
MRLPSQGATVQSDGDFSPSDFKIEISAHAFSTLSKGLYSNPFRAIVRELCCNAWDSHVAAGTTDKAFELYLPNHLAPVFKIRDFGVGLSEEGIRSVYTTYFKTTKLQSDNQTGCFGLGSKSPYAYTKKFTVISYFNGVMYHYSAIINERGYPQIMKMTEEETSEPNGLEVSFNVQENDFYDFERAAKIALRPFVVKPIVKGITDFKAAEYPDNHLMDGKGWKLFRTLEGGNICSMGNVEYPIEATRSGFSSNAKKVLGLAMVIDFPLGSFEMTPAREAIQWTEFSVQNINERLEQIHDEVYEQVTQQITSCANLWEATLSTHKYLHSTGLKALGISPVWNGTVVKSGIELPEDKGITLHKYTAVPARRNSSSKVSVSANKVHRIEPRQVKFYLADFKGAEHRLNNHIRDYFASDDYAYLVGFETPGADQLFYDKTGLTAADLTPASTIPKRDRNAPNRREGRLSSLTGSKARAFQFKTSGASGYSDSYWTESDIELDEPDLGVFVEVNRWNPEGTVLATAARDLRHVLKYIEELGFDLPDGGLVGIKTAHVKKFDAHPNWVRLDQWVRDQLAEFWQADSDFRYAYEFFQADREDQSRVGFYRSMVKKLQKDKLLAEDSFLTRFYALFDRIYKWEKAVGSFHNLSGVLTDFLRSPEPSGQFSLVMPSGNDKNRKVLTYEERLHKEYPLFPVIWKSMYGNTLFNEDKKDTAAVAEYIRLVDERRAAVKAAAKI